MVGIADLAAWQCAHALYYEVAPSSIKKYLTGCGSAGKEEVAAALAQYVGKRAYETDDESDAVAVGVAWLLKNDHLEKFSDS